MRLSDRRPVSQRRRVSLTPLIDVVFLLLIFFMLASTFLKFGTVKVETAGAGAQTTDISKLALIHVGPGNTFRIAGQSVEARDLPTALAARIAQGQTHAIIILQRTAKVADLIDGLTRIRRSGFQSVRVVD
jgi:biopolymer transport protein ExbD